MESWEFFSASILCVLHEWLANDYSAQNSAYSAPLRENKKLALHEKKNSAFKQEHVNLLSTSVNLKKVANPLYIGVLTT
jgi:hypothetical protein